MNIILLLFYVIVGFKFGNWKQFKAVYPSLLFLIIGDLLYQFLLYRHTMWMFHPVGFLDRSLSLNHTLIALGKMAIQYPVTVSIFLGRMPTGILKKVLWILLWCGIYTLTEGVAFLTGVVTYHHGWHFGWDLLFNVIMFSLLTVHHKKPLIAWLLSVVIVLGLWWIFDVPFSVLK